MGPCEHCRDLAARAAIARLDIEARKYLGVRFLHQGRNPARGIDCVGLLVLAARDLGFPVDLHDRTDYDRNPAHGKLEGQLRAAFGSSACCLIPGCVVSIDFAGETRHVGIIGEHPDGLSIIHTSSTVQRVTERRLTPAYLKHITGIYRVEAV